MKNLVERRKMFLQEGTQNKILQLAGMSINHVDISKMVKEIAHQKMEGVILITQLFHFLNVNSVSTNNSVAINLFVSFTIQKDKMKMGFRQMLEKFQGFVDILKVDKFACVQNVTFSIQLYNLP